MVGKVKFTCQGGNLETRNRFLKWRKRPSWRPGNVGPLTGRRGKDFCRYYFRVTSCVLILFFLPIVSEGSRVRGFCIWVSLSIVPFESQGCKGRVNYLVVEDRVPPLYWIGFSVVYRTFHLESTGVKSEEPGIVLTGVMREYKRSTNPHTFYSD